MNKLPTSLAELSQFRQFILYRLVASTARPGKMDKKPCDVRGRLLKWGDRSLWLTAEEAELYSALTGYSIGFIFTPEDDFFFIDIDNCKLSDGKWSGLAISVMQQFAGAYMEVSNSGNGIHIIGRGKVPVHRCRNSEYGLEFYTKSRFVALTGLNAIGSAGMDFTIQLIPFVNQYFTESGAATEIHDLWHDWQKAVSEPPSPHCSVIVDDDELLDKMLSCKAADSIFGDKPSFADLWENNEAKLESYYLNEKSGEYDRSAADAALIQRLCFWTGNDAKRIENFMFESGLYRDKYDCVLI